MPDENRAGAGDPNEYQLLDPSDWPPDPYIDMPLWDEDDDNDNRAGRDYQHAGGPLGGTPVDDPDRDGDAPEEPPEGDWGILAW